MRYTHRNQFPSLGIANATSPNLLGALNHLYMAREGLMECVLLVRISLSYYVVYAASFGLSQSPAA